MTCIYGLFSTADGRIRYVGQTIKPPAQRLREHVRAALTSPGTQLHAWIRWHIRLGNEVQAYVIQSKVFPSDLNQFEFYWISQFANLLNQHGVSKRAEDTDIARTVHEASAATARRHADTRRPHLLRCGPYIAVAGRP